MPSLVYTFLLVATTIGLVEAHDDCPEGANVRRFDIKSEATPSVYDDLTIDEMNAVNDFMKSQSELDIKEGTDAMLNSTYIYNIEGMTPPKADILAFLDSGGQKPERYAWVVLYRGDQTPAVIEDYKVGPLPSITGYEKVNRLGGQQPLEYYRRSVNAYADVVGIDATVAREMVKVDELVEAHTGYKYNDCGDHCLMWDIGTPGSYMAADRSVWMTLLRKIEGAYLHPIGLEFRIRMGQELDHTKWTVDHIRFRDVVYTSFEDMKLKLQRPNTSTQQVFENDKNLFSSLNQRGGPLPEKVQRGPKCFMPDGRRFSVDGHHIEWQGWSFDFNMRSIIGLQVHDVRFKNERIVYEFSLSEISVIYASTGPTMLHSAFIDSTWSLGEETYQLYHGLTCPDHAEYFDFAHFGSTFKPRIFPKSACVFEHQGRIPLRYHYQSDHQGSFYHAQGMPGNVLVLRSVITVAYYEYIYDYVFYQNGAIEVTLTLSGYVITQWFSGRPGDVNQGFEIHPKVWGSIHNHLVHFKVDMDIIGKDNRFETLDVQFEEVDNVYESGGQKMMKQMFIRNLRATEKNATYKYNFDTPKYLVFHNHNSKNHVGNERGYRLVPAAMNKQVLPETWSAENAFSWARYQVAVTRQKDSEPRASSAQTQVDLADPTVNFQDFIDDDESLVDEDLVAWVTLGSLHIPHSDDIPIVQTPGMSLTYYLLPFNFFDQDPSLASRDNMRVDPRADDSGSDDVIYSGESYDLKCEPRFVKNITGYRMKTRYAKQTTLTSSASAVSHIMITSFCISIIICVSLLKV